MKRQKQKKQRRGRSKINVTDRSIMKRAAGSLKEHLRRQLRGNEFWPNSSKVGAGFRTAIRQSYKGKHRKNHRTNELIRTDLRSGRPISQAA